MFFFMFFVITFIESLILKKFCYKLKDNYEL